MSHEEQGHWMVIYQQGGLIDDIQTCLPELAVIAVDWDEFAEGDESDVWSYYGDLLLRTKEAMPPGSDRRAVRLWMRDALELRGLR